ncbi:MAG TPA: hypothetical protein V6D12_21915 [Candidatus Obscuribacterales bacterium]
MRGITFCEGDRAFESPRLVVGKWCGTKYGQGDRWLGNDCQLIINDFSESCCNTES